MSTRACPRKLLSPSWPSGLVGVLLALSIGCSADKAEDPATLRSPGPAANPPVAEASALPADEVPGGRDAAGWPSHSMAYDRDVFHALLSAHADIHREVEVLPDGVATLTESDDPAVTARIIEHVEAMAGRLADGRRLRQWDPLFVALFDRREGIELSIERTDRGVRVRETSTDPQVVALIHAHAQAVDGFVDSGFGSVHEAHAVPPSSGVDVTARTAGGPGAGRGAGCGAGCRGGGGCCGRAGARPDGAPDTESEAETENATETETETGD